MTGIGGLDGPLHDHEEETGLLSPLDGRPERDTDSLVSADTISDSNQVNFSKITMIWIIQSLTLIVDTRVGPDMVFRPDTG